MRKLFCLGACLALSFLWPALSAHAVLITVGVPSLVDDGPFNNDLAIQGTSAWPSPTLLSFNINPAELPSSGSFVLGSPATGGVGYLDEEISSTFVSQTETENFHIAFPVLETTTPVSPMIFVDLPGTLTITNDSMARQIEFHEVIHPATYAFPDGLHGTIQAGFATDEDLGQGVFDVFNISFLASQTETETPLPAALPLFASGGGLLGFLGWRRKKKATAQPA